MRSSDWLVLLCCLALLVGGCLIGDRVFSAEPAAPAITVQAAVDGSLTIASASTRKFRRAAALANPRDPKAWTIIFAEHGEGDDGGIWIYWLKPATDPVTPDPPGPPGPPAPKPGELPLEDLRNVAQKTFREHNLPAAEAAAVATIHETLARQVDTGEMKSPAQLALATQVQWMGAMSTTRSNAWQPWRAAVGAWLDAQQAAGLLAADKMPSYARSYRTIAEALREATNTRIAGKS